MTATEYRYALVNRPPGPGAVPRGAIRVDPRPKPGADHYDMARHGVIVYGHELPPREQANYELALLVDGAEREELAGQIAGFYSREELPAILEMVNEDIDVLRQGIAHALKRTRDGRRVSVGNWTAFTEQVLAALERRAASAESQPGVSQ